MAAVADDLHALGLGFGMYSDAGTYTCGKLPVVCASKPFR